MVEVGHLLCISDPRGQAAHGKARADRQSRPSQGPISTDHDRTAAMNNEGMSKFDRAKHDLVKWMAGFAVIAGVGLIIIAFFTINVCDQQPTSTGSFVTVCRHLNATDPPVIALGAVVLALLGVFYSEISGFGLTLKRSVEVAARTAHEAANEAREASQSIADLRERLRTELGRAVRDEIRRSGSAPGTLYEGDGAPRRGRNVRITQERIDQLRRLSTYPSEETEIADSANIVRGLTDQGLKSLYTLADDMLLSIEIGRRIGQSATTLEGREELEAKGLIKPAPSYPDDPGFVTLSDLGERVGRLLTAEGPLPPELADLEGRISDVVDSEQPTF
jgi:hypothetical protein